MIAANELRIGNFIYWDENQVFKISGITKAGCRFEYDHNQFRTQERIYPIKITTEILEKFGFIIEYGKDVKKTLATSRTVALKDDLKIIFNYKLEIIFLEISGLVFKKHIPASFMHQLQNLYFDLTANELIYGTKRIY
jgi:hypothetical protein